ncbi:hypothetical protein ABZ611_24190 [Streptomyces sp. NPDC007861]|uniref:hypothetical protein n=1 Tax=Streptomyces sp. NPDC007861 TaxID=3154893 RepID=UPI0033EF5FDD
MLAKAFCASDDRVRLAQSALDEAQADRSRMLAAFAVVVGDDGTVAGMMGLQEREVRIARRTVGREGARTVAANLLTRASEQSGEPGSETAHGGAGQPVTEPHASYPRAETAQTAAASAPHTAQQPQVVSGWPTAGAEEQTWTEPAQTTVPVWSPSMDSVLVWSWHSGLDLQVVANELGLELGTVLQRVQILAAEGHLVKTTNQVTSMDYSSASREYSGRHRRNEASSDYTDSGAFGLGGLFSAAAWT